MRLLYLSADPGVPVLGHKGASVHLREMARALSAAGASVTVASPRTEPEGDVLERTIGLAAIAPVLPKSFEREDGLRRAIADQAAQVTDLARQLEADAIYERHSLFSDAGVRAAERLGLPHALEVNAPLRAEALRFRTLPHPEVASEIEAEVFAATARILCVSSRLADLVEAGGVEATKLEVVPNAVAAERFPPRSGGAESAFVVGFAGSLKAWHGVEALLSAFQTALSSKPDMRLEIVGSGPLDATLDAAAIPAGQLVRHGALPHADAIRRMSGWDAGVAPYLHVPDFYFSPLKVLEYMAAGLCPVASDLGDIGTLLGHGRRGVLVAPGSNDGLAAALVALARDRKRARSLGTRAREYVLANCRWERNAERVLAALSAASEVALA